MNVRHLWLTAIVLMVTSACATPAQPEAVQPVQTAPEAPVATPACETASADDQSIIRWMEKSALPVNAQGADWRLESMQPIETRWKDVQIIGIGEQTHGTRESIWARRNFLQWVNEALGPTALVMETGFSATWHVNQYVQGEGNPEDLSFIMNQLHADPFQVSEAADLLNWLRAHNQSVPEAKRIQVYGMDVQTPGEAYIALSNYLKAAAPEYLSQVDSTLRAGYQPTSGQAPAPEVHSATRNGLQAVVEYLEQNEAELRAAAPSANYEQALFAAREMFQYYDAYIPRGPETTVRRDGHMAANIQRIKELVGKETRLLLWAHNGHVAPISPKNPMGSILKEIYGDAYYRLGFVSSEGSFRAFRLGTITPIQHEFPALEPGSVEWFLSCTKLQQAWIDLKSAEPAWLSSERPMFMVGSAYDAARSDMYWAKAPVSIYDGILYVRRSSPSDQ